MLISYSWLQDFIKTKKSVEEISQILTSLGLEVENTFEKESIKGGLKGIVIGEVLECTRHPNADKLSITKVDLGENEPKQIVCGAPNVAKGQKVVVATVGATLYPTNGDSFKITKSKIRGEVSEGMICADDEIGLGNNHDGIIVLETSLANGTPASEYYNLTSDTIFEIGLTPNRVDACSHYGVARDLSVFLKQKINFPEYKEPIISSEKRTMSVEVENSIACPRYSGIVLDNIKVSDSPQWLKNRLQAIGLNPINNIVDITNYVMYELGQPLHAFDYDKIQNHKIVVKTGFSGLEFTTLDEQKHKLLPEDLMICDTEKPLCFAGVFGGNNSGVTQSTKTIFLESAYFSPEYIRKTSQKHSIKTDASFRFERGTDPNMVTKALKQAILLISELSNATIASDLIDLYPETIQHKKIEFSISKFYKIAGFEMPKNEIIDILSRLEIEVSEINENILNLQVPPYRVDVTREADIFEEILRVFGYNNLPSKNLSSEYFSPSYSFSNKQKKDTIASLLTSLGYNEIFTNSLSNSNYYSNDEGLVNILNYNSEELNVMRKTMLHSGLEILQYNLNRKQKNLKLFEFGKVYSKNENEYVETEKLAMFLVGQNTNESWKQNAIPTSFSDIYAHIQTIIEKLGIKNIQCNPLSKNSFIEYGVEFSIGQKIIGMAGYANTSLANNKIKEHVLFAELDWKALLKKSTDKVKYQEISKFPDVRRDLSLIVDKQINYDKIKNIAYQKVKFLLKEVNLFDVYEGDNIEKNKKSYSLSFILNDENKTLTDNVIDKIMQELITSYETELGATIRK